MGSKPKTPKVPTAGENYEDTMEAMLKYQGQRREMELFDQLGNIEMIRNVAPAYANVLMGFEDQYGPQLRAAESEATAQTRAGDIYNVNQLGGAFQDALRASTDPQSQAIRDELGAQVMSELSAGQGMSPELQREVEQGVRRGQTARGISRGGSAVASEAFARGARGLQLQQGRQQAADNFLRQTAATRPDAFSFITGRQGVQQANPALAPQQGSMNFDQMLADTQRQSGLQSQLAYNASQAPSGMGGLGTALGTGAGALFGGAPGAMIGGTIGGGLGGLF